MQVENTIQQRRSILSIQCKDSNTINLIQSNLKENRPGLIKLWKRILGKDRILIYFDLPRKLLPVLTILLTIVWLRPPREDRKWPRLNFRGSLVMFEMRILAFLWIKAAITDVPRLIMWLLTILEQLHHQIIKPTNPSWRIVNLKLLQSKKLR